MSSLWEIAVGIYAPLLCLLLVGVSWLVYWPGYALFKLGSVILRAGEWMVWRASRLRWWAEDRAGSDF